MRTHFATHRWSCLLYLPCLLVIFGACAQKSEDSPTQESAPTAGSLMAGEPTADGVVLQARLLKSQAAKEGARKGTAGGVYFELAPTPSFEQPQRSKTLWAAPDHDFVVKARFSELKSGTRYFYRAVAKMGDTPDSRSAVQSFQTLPGRSRSAPVRFAAISCMPYDRFYGKGRKGTTPYDRPDKAEGYPGLATILSAGPSFVVATGDTVYYDFPQETPATTPEMLRAKYRRQFSQPRFLQLLSRVPFFWMKDDHDYRFNDSDPKRTEPPSHELGIRMFREQLPVVVGADEPTYRNHRVSKELEIWMLEGRDFRSRNDSPDGPEKTILGQRQKKWLKEGLTSSDAIFKIVISPTPILGPDFDGKADNHANTRGFRQERSELIQWFAQEGLSKKVFIVAGDLHWKYHSVHPTGLEEFGTGSLVRGASRPGPAPGEPRSTNRDGELKQPYTSQDHNGGFLQVDVQPPGDDATATIRFLHVDEFGNELYRQQRRAR